MEIVGNLKNYEWGKLGKESIVAQLHAANDSTFTPCAKTPYAELWMGVHQSGVSKIKDTGKPLSSVVPELPFLFKVLSIRKALSIQVHPNKSQAQQLHKQYPDIYKDPNHKPELAIAITPFLGLCGFRPIEQIIQFCDEIFPLKNLLGKDYILLLKKSELDCLRLCYEKLMTSSEKDVAECVETISRNFSKALKDHNLIDVFNTLNRDYPNDVGIISLFFLNVVRLQPGEALYLGANVIHAYLYGDCMECMACSDNVIRAGLTTKFKDVPQLINAVKYDTAPAESVLFSPRQIDSYTQVFAPPVDDFAIISLSLPSSKSDYTLKVKPTDLILIVLQGMCTIRLKDSEDICVERGSIIHIPSTAAAEVHFVQQSDCCDEDFLAYIALSNVFNK